MTEAPPRRSQLVNDNSVALATVQGRCGGGSPQSRRPADAEFRWNVRAARSGSVSEVGANRLHPSGAAGRTGRKKRAETAVLAWRASFHQTATHRCLLIAFRQTRVFA